MSRRAVPSLCGMFPDDLLVCVGDVRGVFVMLGRVCGVSFEDVLWYVCFVCYCVVLVVFIVEVIVFVVLMEAVLVVEVMV